MSQGDPNMMWPTELSDSTIPPMNGFGDVMIDPSLAMFDQNGFMGGGGGGRGLALVGSGVIPFSNVQR
jgi:hypothetical protein